nr:TAL effector repeat-containing protein [Xanthomonas oryzae]
MAQHHEALVGHGFTHAHIVALSQHPAALGTVAVTYQHNHGVARGDTRRHRWRRQTVVRRTRPGGLAHEGGGVERSTVTVGHRPTSQDCKTWRRDRSGGSACIAQCTDG